MLNEKAEEKTVVIFAPDSIEGIRVWDYEVSDFDSFAASRIWHAEFARRAFEEIWNSRSAWTILEFCVEAKRFFDNAKETTKEQKEEEAQKA